MANEILNVEPLPVSRKIANGEEYHHKCPICDNPVGRVVYVHQKYRLRCPSCDYETEENRDFDFVSDQWTTGGMSQLASHEALQLKSVDELKSEVAKESWIALKQYFDGKATGAKAKIACVVVGTLAKEEQAKNNARQLNILEKRLDMKLAEEPKLLSE